MQKLFLKIFLCLSGLLFGFSILTETAFLQNTPPSPKPTARQTPRPKKKTAANTATIENVMSPEDAMLVSNMTVDSVPTQTPPPANSTVRGRVFYSDTGRAVKRAPIMLMREKGFGGPGNMMNALTDGDGNFQMKNVPAGVYYAMINAPGVVSLLAFVDFSKARGGASEAEEFDKAAEGFEKIIVDGITDLEVQIPARRGGAIGGRVMYDNGDPAIGIKVEILRKADGKFLPVLPNFGAIFSMISGTGGFQTDDRGVYRFSGLPAGEYILKVTESVSHADGGEKRSYNEFETMFGGGSSLLSMFYPDVFEPKAANIINLELGQEITEVNMTIPSRSLYKLEGKLVSRKDKSPVKARVTIKREGDEEISSIFGEFGRREQNSVTDENGNWKFKELPKGDYKLVIEPVQDESDYREYQGEYSTANAAPTPKNQPPRPKFAKKIQEVKLEDKDISEMVIEMGTGATIAGTVTVENNEKMPKYITIVAGSRNGEFSVSDNISNYDGTELSPTTANTNVMRSTNVTRTGKGGDNSVKNDFELENVTEGKIHLYISVDDENYYVKSARADGVDLLTGKFEVKDGDNIRNVQIVLSKNVGTLKGKVVNEKNEPLKSTDFILAPVDPARRLSTTFFRSVKTDADGEFEIKLAPAEYAAVFFEPASLPKKIEEIDEWWSQAVKDAQKVTIEAGRTENLTVKKIKR
ncbi:MAG TPA: carboxypeptidase-like regulatory domain-containing protein [Pyrinomonadaceae bacterium]|jgi:hypothetical protein